MDKRITEQLEFVEWLKNHKMYNPMESSQSMQKQFRVFKVVNESRDKEIKDVSMANVVLADHIKFKDDEIKKLREIITQVHSWIVCSAISSPEDMLKSADWIEDITNLSENMLYTKEGK